MVVDTMKNGTFWTLAHNVYWLHQHQIPPLGRDDSLVHLLLKKIGQFLLN